MHLNTLLDIMIMLLFRTLCLRLSKMTGYIRKFDENKNKNKIKIKIQ